jgi:hypothetical protein
MIDNTHMKNPTYSSAEALYPLTILIHSLQPPASVTTTVFSAPTNSIVLASTYK